MSRTNGHESFAIVAYKPLPGAYLDYAWRGVCRTCGWLGDEQRHPLDCGPDCIDHTDENRAFVPEAMQSTEGMRPSVA